MSEIDWDEAPEGAESVEQSRKLVAWCKDGFWWNNDTREWCGKAFPRSWKTIATRPQPRKTIEDAVEYYNGALPDDAWNTVYQLEGESDLRLGCRVTPDTICTREQFEACVAEKEGQEWTHTFAGDKCKIIKGPNDTGQCFIELDHGLWDCIYIESLKPITRKQTISKAEAWDKMQGMLTTKGVESAYFEIKEKYTITD